MRSEPQLRPSIPAMMTAETAPSGPGWLGDIGFWGGVSRVKGLPRVTFAAAERHATVYACCNIIAADLAKVPLAVWERVGDGEERKVRDHPVGYLMNVEAAPGVPAAVLRYGLVYPYALRGVGYAYAPRDGSGELTMIDPCLVESMAVLRAGRQRFYEFEDGSGMRRRVAGRSMVHLRHGAEDGWTHRSPLQVASESVGLALAGQEAAARTAVGGTTKAVIVLSDDYEDDDARMRSARRVRDAIVDPENGGFPVLSTGESVTSLDLSAADQELLASRKVDREQIAGIYRMPPSKLQMLEYGVKANGQQQAIDYLTDCLMHWSRMIESGYNLSLLTEGERRRGLFLRHDFTALLQPTTKELFDALKVGVGGPFVTPNEAQRMAKLPVTPDGDRLYPPSNMTRDEPKQGDE